MEEKLELLKGRIEALKQVHHPLLVALDGGSAAGKSTLGAALAQAVAATLIHMDDFFLPPELRTKARFSQPGGNVHYERVKAEVLEPLAAGKSAEYGVFDCSKMAVGQTARAEARDVIIVEGAYALHPELREFFHLKVLVTVDPEVQKERILRRNGAQMLRRFLEEWIPLEQTYFEACAVKDCCDIIL